MWEHAALLSLLHFNAPLDRELSQDFSLRRIHQSPEQQRICGKKGFQEIDIFELSLI